MRYVTLLLVLLGGSLHLSVCTSHRLFSNSRGSASLAYRTHVLQKLASRPDQLQQLFRQLKRPQPGRYWSRHLTPSNSFSFPTPHCCLAPSAALLSFVTNGFMLSVHDIVSICPSCCFDSTAVGLV
jgi:hypothetical protein